MKYVSFPSAVMLAGVAQLLSKAGIDTDDLQITLDMEAPYLLLYDEGTYRTGAGLFTCKWINQLYLLPKGFRLVETRLPQGAVPAFLRTHTSVLLHLEVANNLRHMVVFDAYRQGRYEFINLKSETSREPDHLSLSMPMLKRRLKETVILLTLEPCSPEPSNIPSLLLQTMDTIKHYYADLLKHRELTVTREELQELHKPLFRALMQDMLPMAALIGDASLLAELEELRHDYTHIFYKENMIQAALYDFLPRGSIARCLIWMRENVMDRYYTYVPEAPMFEVSKEEEKNRLV